MVSVSKCLIFMSCSVVISLLFAAVLKKCYLTTKKMSPLHFSPSGSLRITYGETMTSTKLEKSTRTIPVARVQSLKCMCTDYLIRTDPIACPRGVLRQISCCQLPDPQM